MKNKMKILSCQKQWINDLYTIPFSDLKKTKYSMSSKMFRNYGNFGRKVTKSTVCHMSPDSTPVDTWVLVTPKTPYIERTRRVHSEKSHFEQLFLDVELPLRKSDRS